MTCMPVVCQRCGEMVDLQQKWCQYCDADLMDVFA
jgi:RNA polymerase subunit RPABC4/transcription elongation factor Spt4